MNYYIDFDNTLYNTPLIKDKIQNSISESVCLQTKNDYDKILQEVKTKFNNNIYILAKDFSTKYNVDESFIVENLNKTILNGEEFVFKDSIPFLERLKKKGHNIYLLSFSKDDLKYHTLKISGSNLINYFDLLYITKKPKYELDIDYTNGIFIDDNPNDLIGLYSKNPIKVIRLRRKGIKYSAKDLNISDIEEYENFDDIIID